MLLRRFLFYWILPLLLPLAAQAQHEQLTFARGLGMGGANLCLEGAQGILYNPAALVHELPGDRTPMVFTGVAESFGKAGIRNVSAGMAGGLPFQAMGGLGILQSSNAGWRQSGIRVALAKRAGIASIGVQAGWQQTAYFEAARYNRFNFSIGGLAYPLPGLRLAAAVHNLGKPDLGGRIKEPSPVAMQAGALYQAGKSTLFALQADKFGSEGVTVRVGLEHKIIPQLALRVGASQNPGQAYAGLGLQLKKLNLDYGFGYHPTLGSRHSIGLSLSLAGLVRKRYAPIDPDCIPDMWTI